MGQGVSKWSVLTIATLSSFLTPFMGSAVNVALPIIGTEFSLDAVSLSWIATAYLLASAMFIVPFGRMADIHGMKKIFIIGIFIYLISAILCPFSVSAMMLISCRFLEGIGAAMIYGTSVAILTFVFPRNERGRALGINVTAVYVGLSVGPFLGGILTHYVGWRSIFLVTVPIDILILALVLTKIPGDWAESRGKRLDVPGMLLYSVMLLLVMYGFSRIVEPAGQVFLLSGIIGLAAFIWWESRAPSPVLNISLFRHNRVFTFSNLAALINYSATFAVAFLLSIYLQVVRGFNPQDTGILLIAQPIVQAVLSPFAGRLSDRVEPGIVASVGMGMTAVGLFFLSSLDTATPIISIVATLALLGCGFAFFSSPNTNAVMSSVDPHSYGVASGMVSTMRLIGMMLSMGIAMIMFTVFIGQMQITPDLTPEFMVSVRMAFQIFTAGCVIGVVASLVRGNLRK